jgi:hypothetical protein
VTGFVVHDRAEAPPSPMRGTTAFDDDREATRLRTEARRPALAELVHVLRERRRWGAHAFALAVLLLGVPALGIVLGLATR